MSLKIQEQDTLYSLFQKRLAATPNATAYHQFDATAKEWRAYTWQMIFDKSLLYQSAFRRDGLNIGDRVAIMLQNSIEWIVFDKAASSLGLITVPIFSSDSANNCAYILVDSEAKLLLVGNRRQLSTVMEIKDQVPNLQRVVALAALGAINDPLIKNIQQWLPKTANDLHNATASTATVHADDLATIIYTSGTTGNPKGVMLTHRNIVQNAAAIKFFPIDQRDLLVSFLPLSHAFERTVGCYFTMIMGAQVAFADSLQTLMGDIRKFKPSALLAVPRFYERIINQVQTSAKSRTAKMLIRLTAFVGWQKYRAPKPIARLLTPLWKLLDEAIAKRVRAAFGGRLRFGISGGAPIDKKIIRMLTGFGVPIYQGYGLTESSPIISTNRPDNNTLGSVGPAIPGVEVRIGEKGEILTRGACVMRGYWKREDATRNAIDADGWLHTGDTGRMDTEQRIYITGRIKDIIVMANGEKISPTDMEMAIVNDPLIDQALVYGEGRSFLIALLVLEPQAISERMKVLGADSMHHPAIVSLLKKRVKKALASFPGYARVRQTIIMEQPWTVENGMMTNTLKIKRNKIITEQSDKIEEIYR